MAQQPQYEVVVNGAYEIIIGDRPTQHQIWFNARDVEHAAEVHAELGRAIELVRRHNAELRVAMREAIQNIGPRED